MKYILIAISLLASVTVYASNLSDKIVGTWLTVSHQTITVTDIRSDGTFSGTYFNPAFDVRTTFSGKWKLSGDELTLNYLESTSPVMRVPLEDRNQILAKDKDTLIFQTLPKGIRVEVKRVNFPSREKVY